MPRPSLLLGVSLASAALLAACGGGATDPDSDLAGLAPGGSVVYVEATVQPEGELEENVDAISEEVAGISDLGQFIVGQLEDEGPGSDVDFATDIEPWLGERAAVALPRIVDGDFPEQVLLMQTTDAEATEEFVDQLPADEQQGVAVIDDALVYADSAEYLEAAEEGADGESLAEEDRFVHSFGAATEGSLLDLYVDIGAIAEQEGAEIDAQLEETLGEAGLQLGEAAITASLVPRSDRIEVDLRTSGVDAERLPTSVAPELLAGMPADSFAAVAVSGLGNQLSEALDRLDEEGVPGEIPPGALKKGLREAGIDIEAIAGSLQDAAIFAGGESMATLGGAMVLTSDDDAAANAIANLGALLRGGGVSGVTPLEGQVEGFAIRDRELGPKPLVIAGRGDRIAVGYGAPQTVAALSAGSGATLAGDPDFENAVAAVGEDPVFGYVDGPAALRLADSLVPADDEGFRQARRYLRKIAYVVIAGSENDPTRQKLVIGLE